MAKFVVEMQDNVTPEAKKAAASTSELKAKMQQLQKALEPHRMEKKIAGLEKELAGFSKGAEATSGSSSGLSSALQGLAGEAGLTEAAILALPAAAIAASAALIALGMSIAIAEGEERKAFEAVTRAMAANDAAAKELVETVSKLEGELPITKDKLQALSREMMGAGIRSAPALEKALRATAAASALMGDAAGDKFGSLISKVEALGESGKNVKNLAKALQGTGLSVEDVAAALGKPAKQLDALMKAGTITAEQLGSALQDAMIKKGANAVDVANQKISVMAERAKNKLRDLFEGVVDTPGYQAFLQSLVSLSSLLGENARTAGSMKEGITSAFSGIFGIAAKVITWMTIGFLRLAIATVRFYILLFPVLKWFSTATRWTLKWVGIVAHAIVVNKNFVMGLKVLGVVLAFCAASMTLLMLPLYLIAALVVALIGGLIWLVGVIANNIVPILKVLGIALLVAFAPILWPIYALAAVIYAFVKFGGAIWGIIQQIGKWFADFAKKGASVAYDFVAGLVDGIKKGAKWVIDAAKGLGKATLGGIKGALGIKSPSKEMILVAGFMTEGLTQGLEAGEPKAQASGASLGEVAAAGVASAPAASSSSSSSVTVNVAPGAVVVNGAGKSAEEITEEMLSRVLERLFLEQGLVTS